MKQNERLVYYYQNIQFLTDMNKQKSLSQLNNSSAKQKYSFSKAQRFAVSKKSLPLCYNINLNIDLTKSNKFSTSKRQQPFKPRMESPSPKYNISSSFQININKKKGISIGVGRNEMSNSNFSYINKNDNPGPGQYSSEKYIKGSSMTQSIGLKTNDHSIGFLNQKNLNTNPGPGKYNYKQITIKGGLKTLQIMSLELDHTINKIIHIGINQNYHHPKRQYLKNQKEQLILIQKQRILQHQVLENIKDNRILNDIYQQISNNCLTHLLIIILKLMSYRSENMSFEEQHSRSMRDALKKDLSALQQQNSLLRSKVNTFGDMQQKIQTLVKHNSQLLEQNGRMSKIINEKKAQIQILKSKLDTHSHSKKGQNMSHEFQVKKLLADNEHLRAQLRDVQNSRNQQINEIKSQYQLQMQSLKKQQLNGQDFYELQIRKLRQQLQKKQYEIQQNLNKIKRITSESEYEIVKLRQEKQKLKNQFLYLEEDKKNDIDNVRNKLEINYTQQLQTLRKNNLKKYQAIEIENLKMKDNLSSKTMEIDQLVNKLNKQKSNYEDTIHLLQRQNQNIRCKLIELQRINEAEFESLKIKLLQVHEAEIQEIKLNNDKYIECLQNQIDKLEHHIRRKNDEIEELIKQKNTNKHSFQKDNNNLKSQYLETKSKMYQLQKGLAKATKNYEEKIKEKQDYIEYLNTLNSNQSANNQKQLDRLKIILEDQNNEIQAIKNAFKSQQNLLRDQVTKLFKQNQQLKETLKKQRKQKERVQDELKRQLDGTSNELKVRLNSVNQNNKSLEKQNENLKNNLNTKLKQSKAYKDQLQGSTEREQLLQDELQGLKNILKKKQQLLNQMTAEQKQRLQNSYNLSIEHLKQSYQAKIKQLNKKILQLEERNSKRDQQLEQLLSMYKKLSGQLQQIFRQQANKKDITLKFPGATAQLLATKNLFDVYVKTKVLNICEDALQKQANKS